MAHPTAKNKNGCKARFVLNNIFYLSTSLDAPWSNPGLGSLRLRFVCWKILVLQHPQLLPTNCCCALGVQGGLSGGGCEGWADITVGWCSCLWCCWCFWAPYSNLSCSPGLQRSSQFPQKAGCAGFFLDAMKRVVLKTWQSMYCDALQCVPKDAEALPWLWEESSSKHWKEAALRALWQCRCKE